MPQFTHFTVAEHDSGEVLQTVMYDVKICARFCWVYNLRGIAMSLDMHIFSFRRRGQIVSQSLVLIPLRVLHPRAIS